MRVDSKSGRWVIPRATLAITDATRLQLNKPMRRGELAKTLKNIDPNDKVPNAETLDSEEELSCYFSEPPVKRLVHLVVQRPPGECPLRATAPRHSKCPNRA